MEAHRPATRPHIAIVGAGFAGFQAAQSLAASREFEITLVDRDGRHVFTPLIYQVATGILKPDNVAVSPRSHLPRHVRVLTANVERIDFDRRCLMTDDGAIAYDYLVLATGARSRIANVPGARDHALSLTTLEDAIAVRQRIADCLANCLTDDVADSLADERRDRVPSVAIVGGGTTGCELAGSLAEWARLLDRELKIHLIQSGESLLAEFDLKLGKAAQRRLQRLGVEIFLGTRVQRVMKGAVLIDRGVQIAADVTIWTAGVTAAVPQVSAKSVIGETGKLRVRPTLQLEDLRDNRQLERVYAIGDVAIDSTQRLPSVAPVALQQGVAVARNIRRQARGQSLKPFRYLDKGRLAIVGDYLGVGRIAGVPFSGAIAWFLWLAVHWVYLPGWGNRRAALSTWWRAYKPGTRSRQRTARSQPVPSSISPPS